MPLLQKKMAFVIELAVRVLFLQQSLS